MLPTTQIVSYEKSVRDAREIIRTEPDVSFVISACDHADNSFSVLIPVLNEEKIIVQNVQKLIKFLETLQSRYEVIIVDNGSYDTTPSRGKFLEEKFPGVVRFLQVDKRGAVGWAFRKGVLCAKYNKIVSLDMDLSINLDLFIPRCLKLLDSNSIVVGSKFMKGSSQKRPLLRKFASGIFIVLSRVFLDLQFSDYSMSAKGYKRNDIIGDVDRVDRGSSYVIELMFFAEKRKLETKQIPVHCVDGRSSKFTFVSEVLYRLTRLLNLWLTGKVIDRYERWVTNT
jgi:glycosyltransferase involved in cell wall biosynthesis